MWHHQRREAPDGTIALHTVDSVLPWVVVSVPSGVTGHYPTQRLPAQEVGTWQVLPRETREAA
jgi:hypothetical protein